MVQHEHAHRGVDRAGLDRGFGQVGPHEAHVVAVGQAPLGRVEHLRRGVHGHHLTDPWGQQLRRVAGAAAQVGHGPIGIEQAEQRLVREAGSE